MLFCAHQLRNFYAAAGWKPLDDAHILFGDLMAPMRKADNLVMMLVLSPAGAAARGTLEREPLHVGPTTW